MITRRPLRARRPRGPRGRHQTSQAMLAAGQETGWWDEHGVPAPWPADFHHPDSGWTSGTHNPIDLDELQRRNGGQPPF